jgi:dUTP pyrophosphatase
MSGVEVKFRKINETIKLPAKQTTGSGAYDIHAFTGDSIEILPGQIKSVSTGLFVEIPHGFIISIRPRSGLSFNSGITLINSPGTIDSDYRGEVKILLINHGSEPFHVNNGDRIAQLILEKTYDINWVETKITSETSRGENGFGSTGKH